MALREERMNPEALSAAINDGINRYVRDVLIPKGLIDLDRYDSLGRELDDMRQAVCAAVADKWKVFQFDPDA